MGHAAAPQLQCSRGTPQSVEIEVRQRWALWQHSCKSPGPVISETNATEIKLRQRWALPQHFCKPLSPLIFAVENEGR